MKINLNLITVFMGMETIKIYIKEKGRYILFVYEEK